MATKSSVNIPNGTLYNYNPFTNIMPPNESWLYYKYTTNKDNFSNSLNLSHSLENDLSYLFKNNDNNSDIYILYAGSGSSGGLATSTYVGGGGGGGTGEVNLTKISVNNIKNNQININLNNINNYENIYDYSVLWNTNLWVTNQINPLNDNYVYYPQSKDTIVSYINNNNVTINLQAYGNIYLGVDAHIYSSKKIIQGGNGADSAIYYNKDRPIGFSALKNNILYYGSGSGDRGFEGTINTYWSSAGQNTYGNKGRITTINNNNNLINLDINKSYDLSTLPNGFMEGYTMVNFSNSLLKSDDTGNSAILKGGPTNVPSNATNPIIGPDGFVMIFYKLNNISTISKQIDSNITQYNYNPLNSQLSLYRKMQYFLYRNNTNSSFTHTIDKSKTYLKDLNSNYTINILFQGGGGYGGDGDKSNNGKAGTGGGGGGGGGELIKTTINFSNLNDFLNYSINITIGKTGKSTTISTPTKTYTAKSGKNGDNGKKNPGDGGTGGNSYSPYNIDTNTVSYGSSWGGGGGGYSTGSNGNNGNTNNNNYIKCTSTSSKAPGYILTSDIGDGTTVNASYGGWGGKGNTNGSTGDNGFVLIYYLINTPLIN